VLAAARHKSKREIEELVATVRPLPAVPSTVRKLAVPKTPTSPALVGHSSPDPAGPCSVLVTAAIESAPPTPELRKLVAEVKPLAPERYKVQFTVSRQTHEQLREAQNLLRHRIPGGDVGAIFERALTVLLKQLHRTRHALVDRPRLTSRSNGAGRHVPAAVKRAVWRRDKGQCAFSGGTGRCTERGFLEYHHVVPFADGGATSADNLELRCRAHNAYEAERWFGAPIEDLLRDPGVGFSSSGEMRGFLLAHDHGKRDHPQELLASAGMTRLLTRCRRRLGQLQQLQVLELLSRLPVRSHPRTRIYFTPGGTGLVFIGDCALRRLGLVPEF